MNRVPTPNASKRNLAAELGFLKCSLLVVCFAIAGSCIAAAQGTYLYNAGYQSDFVSGYSIDPSTGALTPVANSPYSLPQGSLPGTVVTDSQCRHVYAGNWGGTLAAYSINPDGSLTALAGSPFVSGTNSAFAAVNPADTHVFVANFGDSTISVFNQSNGVLTPASGSPFPAGGTNPDFLVVDATGKFLYSVNQASDNVTAFAIGSSGSLALIGTYAVPSGSSPRGLVIDPANKYLYVSNTVSSTMSVFSIDPTTGTLTEVPGSPFPAPFNIYQFAIHPSGTFGWVGTDSGAMYNVAVDPSTGAIQVGSAVSTNANTATVAFDPTGQWFYTNNQGSSAVLDQWHVDSSTSASLVASFPAGVNATYSAICTVKVLTAITVSPANASLPKGRTLQYKATGKYSDNSTADITGSVTWSSTKTSVASISSAGLATGLAQGTTTITAKLGSISGSTALTVTPGELVSLSVTPVNPPPIVVGGTKQFAATGTYSDGSTKTLTTSVVWSSTNQSVASVSSGGLASGLAVGTSNITATTTDGKFSAASTLTVNATLQSINITSATGSFTVPSGQTLQLNAIGNYSDGSHSDITSSVAWTSSKTQYATVSSTGLVTGIAKGNTIIKVKASNGLTASVTVTVN